MDLKVLDLSLEEIGPWMKFQVEDYDLISTDEKYDGEFIDMLASMYDEDEILGDLLPYDMYEEIVWRKELREYNRLKSRRGRYPEMFLEEESLEYEAELEGIQLSLK